MVANRRRKVVSKERARTYADFRVGDVFVHEKNAFVLLKGDSTDRWDCLVIVSNSEVQPGTVLSGWLGKAFRVPRGYTVYRGDEVICTT